MPSAGKVIGARPGSHRVKAHTRRSKSGGIVSVRQHTATSKLRTSGKGVRSQDLKFYMARKASNRSAMIRAARLRALAGRY